MSTATAVLEETKEGAALHEVIEYMHSTGASVESAVTFVMSVHAGERLCKSELIELAQEYISEEH